MENKRDSLVVKVDRTNFRDLCKLNGITTDCVLFNRITWRLSKLEQLEDVGLANCDAAAILKGELKTLFARLTKSIYGEVDV